MILATDNTLSITPGFADPVREQQRAFRAAMDALSRPLLPVRYRSGLADAGCLGPNVAALALTLLDFEVSFWLSPSLSEGENFLTFHTGSEAVARPDEAAFAFLDLRRDALDLASFRQGEPDYPDRSTTIIALCDAFDGGPGIAIRGPGISGSANLTLSDLPADFVTQWRANSARAPLGIDMIFISDIGFMGLPRSSRIAGEAG
jgi:alpha-D-ribose 1-methylphosphonate 5-triphosphate synthase subunit PhnH